MSVIATPTERSLWNFQRFIRVTVTTKGIPRNFDIGDPRSGQFCDLSIIRQWEKLKGAFFGRKPFETLSNIGLQVDFTPWIGNLRPVSHPSPRGHFRSWKVASSFSTITFDRDKLERWKHLKCVQANKSDLLICNMTFSYYVITLTLAEFSKWPFI